MLMHRFKALVNSHALIKSISMHFINLATGALTLVIILLFFDIAIYGRFFQLLTFSLLISQVVVAGFGNSLVSDLSSNDSQLHTSILRYYKRRVMRTQIYVLAFATCLHLSLILTNQSYSTNYFVLITVLGAIFLGANNKIYFMFISLPGRYNTFFLLSSLKNISYVVLVLFGALLNLSNFLLLIPFLIELVTFGFISLSLVFTIKESSDFDFAGHKSNMSFHAAWHALYFEYISKLDVLLFPFAMDPKTFGAYAILANANESIHALYSSVRTQVTPLFSRNSDTKTLPSNVNLKLPLFVSAFLLFLGYFIAQFILNSRDSFIESLTVIYFVLALTTLVFYRVATLGFISIQRKEPVGHSCLYALHTTLNLILILMYIELNWSAEIVLLALLGTTIVTSFAFDKLERNRD